MGNNLKLILHLNQINKIPVVATVILLVIATACSGNKIIEAPVKLPDSFSGSGIELVPDQWWTAFNDGNLNAVVDSALQTNFTLLSAWERLRAAQAVRDRESANYFPSLEGSAAVESNRFSDESQNYEEIRLGLSASYEVDLFGRLRSAVDAESYRAQATRWDYQTTALVLSAEVTRNWYQLTDAHQQLELINKQIKTNETMQELLMNRFEIGQVAGVDVLRQQQLAEATREQKTYALARVQVLQHQVNVLLGQAPRSVLPAAPIKLPELPPLPEAGVPLELVQRRPDVQSAYFLLLAADRDLASAISNQFPRLTISASSSTAAGNAGDLFKDWALSFAGNLFAPLFYGGELRAEVRRNQAVKQQRLYEYGQAILTAFQEVEDALIRESQQKISISSLERQVDLATKAYQQLQVQYLNGSGNYLDVLTALDGIQRLRRDLLTARLTLIDYRIALYRALSGSFETDMMAAE